MKNTTNSKKASSFPVREGKEDSSILNDKKPPEKNKYPQPAEKDKQEKNQPEFIEGNPNNKTRK